MKKKGMIYMKLTIILSAVMAKKIIDTTNMTPSQIQGYYFTMAGMLLIIVVLRRYSRKTKRK